MRRVPVRALCAARSTAVSSWPHGLPLIGTGDWNDGMNRVGELGTRRKRVARLVPVRDPAGLRIPLAGPGDALPAADRWHAMRAALQARWSARPGTATGTAAATSTTARRWAPPPAKNAASIPSPSPGACCPARVTPVRGPPGDGRRRRAADPARGGLALLFTPPFDRSRRWIPATSRAIRPGIRENGGQYTHAATWSVLALARSARADEAASCSACSTRQPHATTREDVERYRVEPYVVAADIYSVAPHVGRGGWTWYTGSAGWLYRAGLEGRGAARCLRHQRPSRLVAARLVQRGAHPRDHAGDLRLPARRRGPTARCSWARTRTRCRRRRSERRSRGARRQRRRDGDPARRRLHADARRLARHPRAQPRPHGPHLADGIVVTPSHNPPEDGGFKYNPPDGGPADTQVTRAIEERANELLREQQSRRQAHVVEAALRGGDDARGGLVLPTSRTCATSIDMEAIRAAGLKLAVDPLGGAASLLGADQRRLRPRHRRWSTRRSIRRSPS
jgi:hypothetical protein